VRFAAITLCVASQRVVPKVRVYFVIDSVRKLLDKPPYIYSELCQEYHIIIIFIHKIKVAF
jgi:hypothetical protein